MQKIGYRRIQLKNFENWLFGSNEIAVLKAEKASELWLSLLQSSALRNQLYFMVGSIANAVLIASKASLNRFNFSQALDFPIQQAIDFGSRSIPLVYAVNESSY